MKRIHVTVKTFITVFVFLIVLLLVFRNNLFLGTALNLGRWVLFSLGILIFWRALKHRIQKPLQYLLLAVLGLMCIEYMYAKFTEASQNKFLTSTDLTFMTYNLFFKNNTPQIILNQIQENNPDILVVQELTPKWIVLLSKMEHTYPYKIIYADKGTHGMGVYSKYKLTNTILLLNEGKKPFAQIVTVHVADKQIQVVNTHLASPANAVEHPRNFIFLVNSNYSMRENQISRIELALRSNAYKPSVLIGDLNTTPYEPIYRELKKTWMDVFAHVGSGPSATFPNTNTISPFLTLDYIFTKGNIIPVSSAVLQGGTSDHLGLIGKVRI